jgi:succinate--hydroxymethylglutarate CoA-transferase
MWGSEEKMSCYFAAVNRNKRPITLDLNHEEGRDIFVRLANDSEIL